MNNKEKLFKFKMIEKGLNQREIANKLNITYNTINNWIIGETPNNIRQYLQLLYILDIEIKDIIEYDIFIH